MSNLCGCRGFSGSSACILELGHEGDHSYGNYLEAVVREASTEKEYLRQQLASRDAEIAELKTVPMKYRRLAFNAKLQDENDQLRKDVEMLRDEVIRCRDWFETQAKVTSKGGPSSWDLMLLRDERDAAEEALAATEPKP